MLQLIGWLGCIYLVVKGFEFFAHDGYRSEHGSLKGSATLAMAIAWLGGVVMFVAFTVQGVMTTSMPTAADPSASGYPERSVAWHDCVTAAKDAVEASACRDK